MPNPQPTSVKSIEQLEAENLELRALVWLYHGRGADKYHMLYGDDGEMQCSTCALDFKRQPINQIRAALDQQEFEQRIVDATAKKLKGSGK